MDTKLNPNTLKAYLDALPDSGVSPAVIRRKLASIQRYLSWAHEEGLITSEVYNSLTAILVTHKIRKIPVLRAMKNRVARLIPDSWKHLPQYSLPSQTPSYYAGIAMMLIIMAILGAGIYSQLFKQKVTSSFAYPVTPTRGTRILSFQGRLTDTLSNPITATTDVTFKLYNVSSGGTALYTGACTGGSGVDPDNDGIFNILIGSDCGMSEIPATVFTENANVYLGITVGADSEMSPRQQIANVGYALNAETLQGLPPGKNPSMIPYINDQGDVLIAASAPGLRSTYASATFNISSANAITLASAGSGDITLNASQSGTLKFQTAGTDRITVVNGGNIGIGNVTNPSAFNVQVAGHVGPNATDTYDLGSVSQEWRNIYGQTIYANGVAVCDANGNNCPSSTAGWTDGGTNVYLTTDTDRVGIGTTNPVSKLHVTGKVTGKALTIFDETGDQALFTASASGVTKFLVDHAGNVGIGVTNPAAKLDIKSGSTNSDVLKLIASDGSRLGRFTETSGGAGWFEVDDAAGTAQALFRADGGASYILSGNFGIGTSSPLEVLDVRGNASVSGNVVLAGSSRALQSTNFNPLTIGGSTTGSILLNPNNGATGGLVAPTTTNVTDLGNSAQQFRNIYGQNLYVNGVAVCDANGNNCPSSSGAWTYSAPYVYPTATATRLGLGTTTTSAIISQLYVTRNLADGALGKALAVFNQTENQPILTASASGTPRLTVLNDGTLQFHQASSITTTTGNLTLNSTGGTTTVSDNLVVTGTSDLQGAVSNSTGNLVLDDTTDIGSASTGVNVTTAGALSDTDGNLVLNDTVDLGSASTGLNVTTAGALSDIDGNLVLNDTTDIGSASTGINVTTAGAVSDIDGNLVLNDTVDIGSSANGLRVDTAGNVIDINGNIVLNDTTDIGSATTGISISTTGVINDIDGNVVIGDTVDLGSATTGINITTAGAISDTDGNISLNDSTDITGSLTLTGTLSDSNSDVQVNDNLDPNTDATFDLGDTTTSWKDLYLTGQICFDDTDCFSASPGNTSGWTDDGTVVRLTTATDQVGIGTATPTSRLHVVGKVTGKALAIFDETGDQAILTASASGTPRLTVLNDGTLQFHQASSITTTTGNLTLNSTGGTTTVSDNLVVTGTSDLQGAVSNSTGNLVLNDTVDIGSASTGVNVTTAGALSDTDGNLVLNDTVDLGSASTGLNVTTAGALSDIDGNLVLNDTTDIGSASTGINVTTAGALSDIDGNVVLNDTVDIGSSANGLRVDTAGTIIDINGNIVLDDVTDIGSASTGLNVTTAGLITDTDGNVVIGDTVDLGSASTGINITTNGVISDSDGNISLNDSTDITGSLTLTGTLSDSNSDVQVNDNLDPNADATFDLGDTTNSWNNIYLTGQICFDDSDCFSTAPSTANVGWVDDGTVVRLTTDTDQVGIGTATPTSRLHVVGKVTGKAMAIFDETGDQAILTASASGTPRLTVLNDGTLQFHQASSITTTTGNLTLNSIGGTTTVSDNLVVTGTSDLQGAVSNSTGNLVLNDTTDIGSASTGVNVTTAGALSDTDGNLVLNDTVDLGSATTGLNVTTAGLISDTDGNVVIGDTIDLGSATTGVNVTTAGALSDTDGNLVLNDTVDIGSSANGLRIDTAGNVIDINGNIVLNDTTDIGSATTGLNVTTAGLITDTDGNVVIGDTVDLGSATTGINITTAGAISDTDGNISLNDSTDITGSLTLTGTLSDSNSDVQVNDNLDPNTDATFDLGDTTTSWRDIYLTGQICFDDTDCFSTSPANISGWTDDGTVVRLTTATDQVGIGTASPTSRLHVTGKVTGKALAIFDETGDQALLTASASGVTKFTVSNGGDITFAGTTGLAGTGNGAGLNFSGTGTHTIQASAGTLSLNAFTLAGAITGGNNNISSIGNITANSSSNTITGFGTIGTNGTTAFTGSTLALTGQFTSTVSTGTAPMVIASTTKVTNLNADLLDGIDSSAFCQTGGTGCPTGLYVDLQGSTPGSQQTGNINISGAILGGYFADTSNTNYGVDPAGTSNFGGYSLKVTGGSLLALDSGGVGIGIGTPVSKLHVNGAITGKALAIFNETGDQALLTASSSGTPRLTVLNDGTLQFHQASSITTTTGNLTLNSTGGTTTVSDNLVVTGTSDLQGVLSDSTSDLVINDNVDPNTDAAFDLGDTTTSWRDLYLTGQICFDDTDCFSTSPGTSAAGWTDGGTNVYLTTTTDNVGIGTTNPQRKVHIAGNSSAANGVQLLLENTNGTTEQTSIAFSSSGTSINWTLGTDYFRNGTDNFFIYGGNAGGGDARLAIDTNGNVGIGTTTPVGRFNVTGAVTGKALAIFNETGDQNLLVASASGVTKFIVDHNGNVGIGSTNNAGKLTLLQTGSTSTDGIYLTNSLGNSGRAYLDSSSNFRLQTGTNNSQLVLHNGGNVGIGTTTPAALLSVGATSQFQVNSSGNLTSINGVTYSWPGSQGGASTVLTNNGSGTLTWTSVGTLTGTGANGQVTFWNGTSTQTGDNAFFWDNTNKLLGIGTNSQVSKLELTGAVKGKALAIFNETGDQDVFVASASGSPVFAIKHNGNVGIGTTAPTAKLEIAGSTSTISNTAGDITITPTTNTIFSSGNIGIGTGTPGGKIGIVAGTTAAGGIDFGGDTNLYRSAASTLKTDDAFNVNGNFNVTTGGITTINLNGTVALNAVCHSGADVDAATNTNRDLVACNPGTLTDYAEYYPTESSADFGEIMTTSPEMVEVNAGDGYGQIDPNRYFNISKLKKSTSAYQNNIVGITSLNFGELSSLGEHVVPKEHHPMPVALNGRVPVKVTSENGNIKPGDMLTTSSKPGIAMKASKPGMVVGKALGTYENPDSNHIGQVMVFVNLSWYDPGILVNNDGNLNLNGQPVSIAANGSSYEAQNADGSVVQKVDAFAKVTSATIVAGLTQTQDAVVQNVLSATSIIANSIKTVALETQQFTTGTLQALSARVSSLTASTITVEDKLVSPVVETESLKVSGSAEVAKLQTSEIKPKDDSVVIDLSGENSPSPTPESNGKLARLIIKGLEGKTVATIDNTGNASFSGTVTAKDASVSGQLAAGTIVTDSFGAKEASIAGTVKAKEIQADSIRGSQIDTIESNISKNDQAVKELSGNVNDIQKLLAELKDQPLPDASYYQNLNQPVSASGSGQLQSNAGEAIYEKLSVTGFTILADAYVTNTFAAGDVQIHGDSVISLASELKLSALNSINLFDGAVTIARDGSITTKGEVIAQGGVRTNDIKPARAGEDINVTLSKNTGAGENAVLASAATPKLKIQDGTGNEVASIDASGSARFRDIALDQYREATASSAIVSAQDNYNQNGLYAPAITTNGKTIGVGTLPANSNVIAIYNEKVSDKSLIYVTPTSPTDNKTLYIAEKVSCTDSAQNQGTTPCRPHFTIAISGTVPHDIQFNWWIVN